MRHGTKASYERGCRCDGCRLCMVLYTANASPATPRSERGPSWRRNTYTNLLPAAPYQRIVRSLLDRGETAANLSRVSGLSTTAIRLLDRGATEWVYPATIAKVRRLLDLFPDEKATA